MPLKDLFISLRQNSHWLQWDNGLQGFYSPKYESEHQLLKFYTLKRHKLILLLLLLSFSRLHCRWLYVIKQANLTKCHLAAENLYLHTCFLFSLAEANVLFHCGDSFNVHICDQSLHLTWQAVNFYAICKPRNMPHLTCQSKNTF